ncbi:4-hydroxybenzoyl-CoA thioesterase family active site [hydrothermal vent metagenome]|uniref:4-hydroxybenzoyl-CoA thioesterase family active site n=1 Tax=hydrothermal vent metagenome TaxID=652676 RepID=A0A3B1CL24_9ZZZZ
MSINIYSAFTSEIIVRPDDIDMNNHVHFSKYLDYFLAARYEQMERDYKISMEEFIEMRLNWVASSMNINYKRPLKLGDTAVVKTQMDTFQGAQVNVNFWIYNKKTNKLAADGNGVFTLINIDSGRPARISKEITDRYSI